MKQLILKLHLFFIPDSYRKDDLEFRKAKILVNTSLITTLFAFSYAGQTFFFDQRHIFPLLILWGILFFSISWLLKAGVSRKMGANFYTAITYVSSLFEIYWTGGVNSAIYPWLCMVAVSAILLNTALNAWIWFIIAALTSTSVFVASRHIHFPVEMNMKFYDFSVFLAGFGLIAIMFTIAMVMENAFIQSLVKLDQKNKIIEAEKKKSDELLLNILPAEVMEELKATGKTHARNYDLVTVLFADFADFTGITEEMPPEDLVSSIDAYFKMIDNIVTEYKVEKIKTVGDAYICAAGLGSGSNNNPVIMVDVALEIVAATIQMNEMRAAENKTVFNMRIGLHSGPLVAGVVGIKKFAYDIWGDTVNTAARMQQNGEPGRINISGTTRELVKHRFNCTYRGRIDAKHKGLIDMYYVEGKK
ncbi:MAG: adenylate/guanylate cyclase domain-containing protein [Bacteroidetes bacterium]|nr:adenylate/guanylate cyclase domain-containing protein [Bacteroidota bacterium]